MIETLRVARTLSAVQRYSQTRLLNPESVMEHTGFNGLVCYVICERLNELGEELDTGLAVMKAMIHDVDEIITGDIPMPTKYYSTDITKSLKKLASDAIVDIAMNLNLPKMIKHWEEAKIGREGAVVALADIIAVVNKVWQESVEFSNTSIVSHVGPTREIVFERIDALGEMLETKKGRAELIRMGEDLDILLSQIEAKRI